MSSGSNKVAKPTKFWGRGKDFADTPVHNIFSETKRECDVPSVNRLVLRQTNQTGFETAHIHTRSFIGCGLLVCGVPTSSAG